MNNQAHLEKEKQKYIFSQKFTEWNRNRAIPVFTNAKSVYFSNLFYNTLSKYQHQFLTEEEKDNLLYEALIKDHKECFLEGKNAFKNISNELSQVYQDSLTDFHNSNVKKKVNRSAELKELKHKVSELEKLVIILQDKLLEGKKNEQTRDT